MRSSISHQSKMSQFHGYSSYTIYIYLAQSQHISRVSSWFRHLNCLKQGQSSLTTDNGSLKFSRTSWFEIFLNIEMYAFKKKNTCRKAIELISTNSPNRESETIIRQLYVTICRVKERKASRAATGKVL